MKIRELQDNGEVNDVLNEMRLDQLFTLYGEVSQESKFRFKGDADCVVAEIVCCIYCRPTGSTVR